MWVTTLVNIYKKNRTAEYSKIVFFMRSSDVDMWNRRLVCLDGTRVVEKTKCANWTENTKVIIESLIIRYISVWVYDGCNVLLCDQ